jgi:hypothetical protein
VTTKTRARRTTRATAGGGCGGVALDCERPHASGGVCQAGVCQGFECVAPWADCNGDWDDGCEVPTGVANQCDANGPERGLGLLDGILWIERGSQGEELRRLLLLRLLELPYAGARHVAVV